MSQLNLWNPKQFIEFSLARILQRLPIDLTSDMGAFFGRIEARRAIKNNRLWIGRLHSNFEKLQKIEKFSEREHLIFKHLSAIGRTYAEFMSQQKIINQGRLEIFGQEYLEKIDQQTIIVSCHLSNWELMGHIVSQLRRPISGIYLPPGNPVHNYLAVEARLQWPVEHDYFPVAVNAVRRLNQLLSKGSNLLLFIDEERDGYVSAPSLGREIPYAGNRWLAAKLAVKHNIRILPAFIECVGKGRYRAIIEPLIDMPTGSDKNENARIVADKLDERLNSWIIPRLADWYWLRYFDFEVSRSSVTLRDI